MIGSSTYLPQAGPVLSGGNVVWAGEDDRGAVTAYRADAASPPAALVTAGRPDPGRAVGIDLLASPDLVVAAVRDLPACPDGCRYAAGLIRGTYAQPLAGPATGPLSPLAGSCDDVIDERTLRPFGLAVSGTIVAYRRADCEGISVRDLAEPGAPAADLPSGAYGPQVAGRYAAYRLGGPLRIPFADRRDPIVVLDRIANTELYRVDGAAGDLLAVDAQGRITLGQPGSGSTVMVASPDAPRPHLIHNSAFSGITRFSDGSIGVATGSGSLERLDLDDGTLQPPELPFDAAYRTGVDASGDLATWVQRTCSGFQIHLAPLAETPARAPAPAECPLRLERDLRAHGRRVLIRPSCAGLQRRCIIDTCAIRVRRAARPREVVAAAPGCDFNGPRQVRARLTAVGARLLHRRTRVQVTLALRLAGGGTDTEPTRRGSFILRRG